MPRKGLYPKYDRAGRNITKAIKGFTPKIKRRRRKKGCGLLLVVLSLGAGFYLLKF